MAKIIINNKYEIKNVYFNDHTLVPGTLSECILRAPTDEEIGIVARFEEEIGYIKVIEGEKTLLSAHGIFYGVLIDEYTGYINFLLKKKEYRQFTDKHIEWFDDKIGKYQEGIPNACKGCSNHPSNGGSGICHCTIPQMSTTTGTSYTGTSYTAS